MSDSTRRKGSRPTSAELSHWFHKACHQEAGALQQLLSLYRPLLLKLAHRQLKGALRIKVSPSDLVQTSVWKATQSFAEVQFDDRTGFTAWLVTILNNEAADVRRRYQGTKKRDLSRERPLASAEAQAWLGRLSASLNKSDKDLSARHNAFEHLSAAVELLPPHYQLVLRLRYYEKLDFHKIAERFERTYDTARVLHNRALKRLRDEITLLTERDNTGRTSD